MESSTVKRKTFAQPRPLAELLPSLGGIFTDEVLQTFTDKKKPRPARVQTLTADKVLKPMSYHEMRASLLALKPHSPKGSQPTASSRKKDWVSSIKVDYKSVSHTANGQLRNHPVRKVLDFQAPQPPVAKPKVPTRMTQYNPRMTQHNPGITQHNPGITQHNPRITQHNPRITQHNPRMTQFDTETPKFQKPEFRPKKSVNAQAKNTNTVRISGICKIPETPVEPKPLPPKRVTIANKENNPYQARNKAIQKQPVLPTPILKNPRKIAIDTPADSSWKSNDASFIQKEKEIQEQLKATTNEKPHCKVLEKQIVSTPSSTPFKDYRSVQEYFNNSSEVENSAVYNDNTIMCFDKPKDDSKREESVIVSLCDLFTKATVDAAKVDADLDTLLEMKIQAESMIRQVDTGIHILNNLKQSQIESLKRVNKLIDEKKNSKEIEMDLDRTLVSQPVPEIMVISPGEPSPIISKQCSPVISKPCCSFKSHTAIKSPSYKVPKKSECLKRQLVYKSMPNVSTKDTSPVKDMNGKALNVYMELKGNMNFLSTPSVNRVGVVPDTPMVTSHNLQKQLDKLYSGS